MTLPIKLASRAALQSTHPQHQLGAVVMRGGAVVSVACNLGPGRGHAEARALRPHCNYAGCHLFVVRLRGQRISRPCPDCWRKILDSGVSRVTYFDGEGWVTE